MEVTSSNNTIFPSVSTSQTASSTQNTSSSFNALVNSQNQEITEPTEKKETFRVVAFIDKYTSFSSLSSTEEKIFRDILADDKLTMQEMKSLTYEQVKKLADFMDSALYTSNVSPDKIPLVKGDNDIRIGGMLHATQMTDNEDFNKAIFETVQTIDNQIEMMNFFDRLSGTLGWNDKTCLIPERDIPELRKNSENEDWKILDYKKFITANISELNAILKNPVYDEDKPMYQKLLNDFIILEKKHNEIKNKYI